MSSVSRHDDDVLRAAAGGPGAQWDALSLTAKAQIFTFIFLMEVRRRSAFAFLLFQFNSRLFA